MSKLKKASILVNDANYVLNKKLGRGGFGYVYSASVNMIEQASRAFRRRLPHTVAVKVEDTSKCNNRPQLNYEYKVYKVLINKIKPNRKQRIPKIYNFVYNSPRPPYNALVMEQMGFNVSQIFDSYSDDVKVGIRSKPFSAREVYMVFSQALDCLRAVHECGFIHRDIKPENFCVRGDNSNMLAIVDFGLCKCYKQKNGVHIPFKTKKGMLGTPRYMSLNCHQGYELSRRDDIESLLYMVLFLQRPKLPWQNVKFKNKKEKYATISKIKRESTVSGELFDTTPEPFRTAYREVRNMAFDADPDYDDIGHKIRRSLEAAELEVR